MKKVNSKVLLLLAIVFVAFTACKGKSPKAQLMLAKDSYNPGEAILVKYVALPTFDTSAWVGIIPSAIKHGSESLNDQHDLTYKYLKKSTSGEMNFTAPVTPGSYDLRMNDTDKNGVEVAYATFKVVGEAPKEQAAAGGGQSGAKLTLSKTAFAPGERITVQYVALPSYASNAWIGIIPSGIPHGNESKNDRHDIAYKYLKKSTAGEKSFKAPRKAGSYDLRMHDTDSNGIEVAYVTFTVGGATPTAAPAPTPTALKFNIGDSVKVEWKGSWWPARVIAVRGEDPNRKKKRKYRIHYDGYSKSWDEWVADSRIRNR